MFVKQLLCASLLVFLASRPVKGAVSKEQMEKLARSMRNSCLQKIDTTEEKVLAMRQGEFPEDENLACYTNCIMKAMRTYKNGVLDINMILKQIDASMPPDLSPRVKATVRACQGIKGEKNVQSNFLLHLRVSLKNEINLKISAKLLNFRKPYADTETEPCKMTYEYVKCAYQADPEIFFFP
ncbi:odorant binding protein 5 [Calliopsis andreniformis]|uniref:odorant binding protein 5 n=1 Tax=Calliopsis andreniformis TaxID=337506 RepID=UPI003FCD771A